MFLIERSEYDDDVSMLMMFLIERSEYDDDVSMLMMFMINRSEYDDDDVVTDREVKVLKILLLIEKSKC